MPPFRFANAEAASGDDEDAECTLDKESASWDCDRCAEGSKPWTTLVPLSFDSTLAFDAFVGEMRRSKATRGRGNDALSTGRGDDGLGEEGLGVGALDVVGALDASDPSTTWYSSRSRCGSEYDMGSGDSGLVRSCLTLIDVIRFLRFRPVMCFSPCRLRSQLVEDVPNEI